jgi:hypothetical protein
VWGECAEADTHLADPENIKYLLQRALPLLNISAPFPGTPGSQGK